MAPNANQAMSAIFGALLLGVWIYVFLWEDPDWLGWGALGLMISTGVLAVRLQNDTARFIVYVITGLGIGITLAAAIGREQEEGFASFLTFFGGALVLLALPRGAFVQQEPTYAPEPMQYEEEAEPAPAPRRRRKADE